MVEVICVTAETADDPWVGEPLVLAGWLELPWSWAKRVMGEGWRRSCMEGYVELEAVEGGVRGTGEW